MIQRIQTVYLLIASILLTLAAYFPLIEFQIEVSEFVGQTSVPAYTQTAHLHAFSVQLCDQSGTWTKLYTIWSLGIATVIAAIVDLVIIFLYKNRKLQIKTAHYSFLVKVALLAAIGYFTYIMQGVDVTKTIPQIGTLFIVIAMILDWLAVKGIRKDEALVRSIDRIR